MSEPAIEISGLTKKFGALTAVNNLDLSIPTGSVYGFLGRNGAGKTTTIRILLGLASPTSGSVSVLGMDPKKDGKAIKAQVGYVAENQSMYGWMKVKEIIKFTAGFYKNWDSSIASDFCEKFELDPLGKGQEPVEGPADAPGAYARARPASAPSHTRRSDDGARSHHAEGVPQRHCARDTGRGAHRFLLDTYFE